MNLNIFTDYPDTWSAFIFNYGYLLPILLSLVSAFRTNEYKAFPRTDQTKSMIAFPDKS